MAVNTQKLLPSSRESALLKISSSKIIRTPVVKKKTISTQKLIGSYKDSDSTGVQNLLSGIDSLFKVNLREDKKEQSKKRKEKEKSDYEKEEKKLEAPKEAKKFKFPTLLNPAANFLDRIKRFIFFTALGWLFTKFQDQLPKLVGVFKIITQVYGFVENTFKFLLESFVTFVDLGYKTHDNIRKSIEKLGGENAAKTFDEFSNHLKDLLNAAIIASMLTIRTAPKGPKTPPGTGSGYQAGFAAGYAAGLASRGKGPRYRAPGEAAAGRTFEENLGRQALTRERMLAPTGPRGPLDRIGRGIRSAGAQLETGTLFKRGTGIQKALYNAPGKIKGVIPKGGGGVLSRAGGFPVIGPLIVFGVRTLVYGEKPQKAAAAAIGTAIGEVLGGILGGAAATGLGIATGGLGALVAGLLVQGGRILGGLAGEWLGAALYDFVAGFGKDKKPQKKATGGTVYGNKKTPPTRTIRITKKRKPQKVQPEKTNPGKDVGGKLKIEKLYPNPKQVSTTSRSPNPYKALTGVSKDLKKGGWIGYLMSAGVDVALGQKVNSKKLTTAVTGGLENLSQIDQFQNQAIGTLNRSILGMTTGGEVPSLGHQTENVNNLLSTLIQSRVNEALKNVTDELIKTPGATPGGGPGGPGGGPGGAGGAPTTKEQRDAYERIRSIAEKLGSPNPDVTASIAMWETGWLANPDSVYFASNKTNPFGQTGKGSKGSVIGKDGQEHAVYNSIEEGVKAHLDNWKNDYKGRTAEEIIESIRQGGGRGMYNTNPAWSNNVLGVYNSIKQPPTKIIKGGPIKGGGIITQRGDPDAEQTGIDISLGGIGANIQNPFDNLKITGTGFQGSGSGETGTGYGNYVTGEVTINGKKYELLLGHLDRISVKKGDVLSAGDIIGKQGITGRATGPHVTTHVNALSGGDPQKILDAVENVWTSGGSIQTDLGQKPKPKPKPAGSTANKGVIFDPSKKMFFKLGGGFLGTNQQVSVTNTENTNLRATVKAFGLGQGVEGQIKQAKDGNLYKFINGKWTTYIPDNGGNMQGGGFMGLQNRRNYSSLSMYPSYSAEGGMMIAIQPMIIEKPIPIPMSQNKTIIFPVPISVNNNTASLSR